MSFAEIILLLLLIAIVLVLLSGVILMVIGGEKNKKYAGKLMTARVMLQGIAILIVGIFLAISSK